MYDYLERMREKPKHVRQRMAIGAAAATTAIIAAGWLAVVSTNASFSLTVPTFAQDSAPQVTASATNNIKSANLLGGAAAALSGNAGSNITITNAGTSTPVGATVIPF